METKKQIKGFTKEIKLSGNKFTRKVNVQERMIELCKNGKERHSASVTIADDKRK